MSYQVLARKYRPQRFSDVIGQEHVTRTLKNAIEQGRIAHGYIFSGHRGIGKTTVARILAMCLNCRSSEKPVAEPCGTCDSCQEIRAGNSVDVIEIDAATNRGIDEIRELREAARYRPARDRFKIYILDEAHQITDAAFNALLKTLEEPPGHVVFMLATTQPEDIPQTIRSRCQHFSFRAVRFEQIVAQLRAICAREKIAANEDDALALLAEAGDGSMRDALSLLDQAIASSEGRLSAESVRQLIGVAPSRVLEEIMQRVSGSDSRALLEITDRLLNEGQNPVHFARQLVRFLRNAIVAKVSGAESSVLQISSDERARIARTAELFSEEDLARHLQIMLRTHAELGYRQEQRFHLELGLLKLAHAQRLLPIEQLLSGADGPSAAPDRKLAIRSEPRKSEQVVEPRPFLSPFAADSARKGTPRSDASSERSNPSLASPPISSVPVIMGAAAPAVAPQTAREPEPQPASSLVTQFSSQALEEVRLAVLNALASAGQTMLGSLLETGDWNIRGNELTIRIAASATLIEMSASAEARRMIIATAGGKLGRAVKLEILPGASASSPSAKPAMNHSDRGTRSRAEHDPVVQRLKEKFGAQIRTVIDYNGKK